MTKIKICGVMTCHEASMVGDAGVEYIGLNFVENSQRFLLKEKAVEVSTFIHTHFPQMKLVGIFQDTDLEYVHLATQYSHLDLIQLHGVEGEHYIKRLEVPVIKTIHDFSQIADFPSATYFLCDRAEQGKGSRLDPFNLAQACATKKCFVAGGLHPQNVGKVIQIAKPYAVDVSSGVRINNSIDQVLLDKFVHAVKSQKITSS